MYQGEHVAKTGPDGSGRVDWFVCLIHSPDEPILSVEVLIDGESIIIRCIELCVDSSNILWSHPSVFVFQKIKYLGW